MGEVRFSHADRRQMKGLGITEDQVRAQLEVFRKTSFFVHLDRFCTPQDGVQRIPREETEKYLDLHRGAAQKGRFTKFVPASGAATRMFQSLLQIYHLPQFLDVEELRRRVECGVSVACDFLTFMQSIRRFAFVEDLEAVIGRDGLSLDALIERNEFRTILDYVLTERGLNFCSAPKGLIKFHKYSTECRTAFEEHMVEAARYISHGGGLCGIHFTISPEHEMRFMRLSEKIKRSYEERFGVSYDICFSFQKESTNTIAVDANNQPFREISGRLVFRPGGHGALIENLNDLKGDLIYIKNVDNLVPDHFGETTAFWKKVLGGYLVEIQETVHGHIRKLKDSMSLELIEEADRFAREKLLIQFPRAYETCSLEEKHAFLLDELNRPIRVCGVVKNIGEPGGAPFWVKGKKGSLSLQIVEKAQVNSNCPEQQRIWMSSTHFNPVDIVCAVRDYEDKLFDLRQYVDPEAVFITKKSKDGRELKALELPGLWNGAMSDWITIVVDVPRITFNPVKTVFDLLKPEHQPENHG
jgi:hypothetical protein